jgi:hypothetical protein
MSQQKQEQKSKAKWSCFRDKAVQLGTVTTTKTTSAIFRSPWTGYRGSLSLKIEWFENGLKIDWLVNGLAYTLLSLRP